MKDLDKIINELVNTLLKTGSAEYNQDGLEIKTSYNDGIFKINANISSSEKDDEEEKINKINSEFESYIKSLSDDFFIEVIESFEDGKLKQIQNKIDSKNLEIINDGINEFMSALKNTAYKKIKDLDADIEKTEKDLSELIEIRDSYIHVINKNF